MKTCSQDATTPCRRVELPKPGGVTRNLGIPTVLDRFVQQVLLQVLQEDWDPTFSDASFGFRPKRGAHQAIIRAQSHVKAGFHWAVDMDLEKFFDKVDHDVLIGEVRKRISDKRFLCLIRRYLTSGVLIDDVLHETVEGTHRAHRCPRCWQTCCLIASTRNWKSGAIVLSAMRMARLTGHGNVRFLALRSAEGSTDASARKPRKP